MLVSVRIMVFDRVSGQSEKAAGHAVPLDSKSVSGESEQYEAKISQGHRFKSRSAAVKNIRRQNGRRSAYGLRIRAGGRAEEDGDWSDCH
eukprot:s2822_g3.t1